MRVKFVFSTYKVSVYFSSDCYFLQHRLWDFGLWHQYPSPTKQSGGYRVSCQPCFYFRNIRACHFLIQDQSLGFLISIKEEIILVVATSSPKQLFPSFLIKWNLRDMTGKFFVL
jgi:hypothetical protein